MICIFVSQKEHSDIIANLRATNEHLFLVTDLGPAPDLKGSKEDSGEDCTTSNVTIRTRKKGHVELISPVIQSQPAIQVSLLWSSNTYKAVFKNCR